MSGESDAERWDPGFVGDHYLVTARLGPFRKLFLKPREFTPRFYHRLTELTIEDWSLPVPDLRLGEAVRISVDLSVRFQPTLDYARSHPDSLDQLSHTIKLHHQRVLLDMVLEELRVLEDPFWLGEGYAGIERRVETLINETLAGQGIRCRTRCVLSPEFQALDEAELENLPPWSPYRPLYQALLQRQHRIAAEAERRRLELEAEEEAVRMERERARLLLEQRETELRKAKYALEAERLKAELAAEETLQAERRAAEARQKEEQVRHEQRLREMEIEAELQSKTRRTEAMEDADARLRREIELLALERQRLLLEEEVRDIKLARAKGWIINASRRFQLGQDAEFDDPEPPGLPPELPET
ncbi:hypothetical protein [Methylococcus capsulatus]|uniref:hypothetical protein n=1 Tax=Methylococcus capsulatus TaxID=414 RepID=UPI002FDB66DD